MLVHALFALRKCSSTSEWGVWLSVINHDVHPKPRLTRIFRLREREREREHTRRENRAQKRKKGKKTELGVVETLSDMKVLGPI